MTLIEARRQAARFADLTGRAQTIWRYIGDSLLPASYRCVSGDPQPPSRLWERVETIQPDTHVRPRQTA